MAGCFSKKKKKKRFEQKKKNKLRELFFLLLYENHIYSAIVVLSVVSLNCSLLVALVPYSVYFFHIMHGLSMRCLKWHDVREYVFLNSTAFCSR